MQKTWGDITNAQKKELAELYEIEKDPEVLAKYVAEHFDVDLKPKSVARRIREFVLGEKRAKTTDDADGDRENYRTVHVSDNELDVVYTGPTTHTLDELLSVMRIDTSEWEVISFVANSWEGFRAKKATRLNFSSGVMTGDIDDQGGVTIVPLYQVKARLIKRKPVLVEPVVTPVIVDFGGVRIDIPTSEARGRTNPARIAMILPDPQFGFYRERQMAPLQTFHDREALAAALTLAEVVQPDDIIWLGDLLDFSEFSTHFKINPLRAQTTQHALLETAWWLAAFRGTVPGAKISVLEGNHDQRFSNSLMENLPAAFGLQAIKATYGKGLQVKLKAENFYDLPVLLDFVNLGVDYIPGYPDNSVWLGDLEVIHGNVVNMKAGGTVALALSKYTNSVMFGHIHRIEQAFRSVYENGKTRTITAATPGCLCRTDGAVPGSKARDQWQQGIALVNYTSSRHHIGLYEIVDGSIMYDDGMLYEGKTLLKTVRKALKDLVGG